MWPFKANSILSAEDEEWQVETWRWLLEQLGGKTDLKASALVTPTRDFFPPSEANESTLARLQPRTGADVGQPASRR